MSERSSTAKAPNAVWVLVDQYGNTLRVTEDRDHANDMARWNPDFRLVLYERVTGFLDGRGGDLP